jgi:site-specific DNA recombinase
MEESLGIALYARVSSQRQADEQTIQSQLAALKQRISGDGLTLDEAGCFLDEGYSGATLIRPSLERLRDLAWAGGLDRLYVHSPDRLARKYAYQVVLLEEFKKQGVEVVFLNHDSRGESPEGDLLVQMQGMIAEYERAKILERTRRGRRYAARQGKVSAIAHAPYGYRYVTKHESDGEPRYDIVLEAARVVKEIFSWVGVEGLSLGEVVRRLAEREISTPTGKTWWDRATIHGILVNPAYHGTARYGKTRLVSRKPGRRPKRGDPQNPRQQKVTELTSLDEQDPIPVPALVSRELFEAVAERLAENRRRHRQQKQGAEYLLGGLLVCCACGSAYCGRRLPCGSGRRYVYYRCIGTDKYRHHGEAICDNQGVNGPRLEAAVWADVCSLVKEPGRLRREFERRLERPATETGDLAHGEDSIARLKRRIARLIDAYENGWLDKAEFEPRIERVKQQLDREQKTLARQQLETTSDEELRLLIGQFDSFAQQINEGLEDANFETRRKLLRLLIQRIEIDRDEVRIVYKVQPRPFAHSPAKRGEFLQDCLQFHSKAQGRRAAAHPGNRVRIVDLTPKALHNSDAVLFEALIPIAARSEFRLNAVPIQKQRHQFGPAADVVAPIQGRDVFVNCHLGQCELAGNLLFTVAGE